jgi:hypothetical protein
VAGDPDKCTCLVARRRAPDRGEDVATFVGGRRSGARPVGLGLPSPAVLAEGHAEAVVEIFGIAVGNLMTEAERTSVRSSTKARSTTRRTRRSSRSG